MKSITLSLLIALAFLTAGIRSSDSQPQRDGYPAFIGGLPALKKAENKQEGAKQSLRFEAEADGENSKGESNNYRRFGDGARYFILLAITFVFSMAVPVYIIVKLCMMSEDPKIDTKSNLTKNFSEQ